MVLSAGRSRPIRHPLSSSSWSCSWSALPSHCSGWCGPAANSTRRDRRNPVREAAPATHIERTAGKDADSRQTLAQALRLELSQNITIIRHLGSSLVFLGLIGTVLGFIIALSGVDPDLAGETENIGPMVSALIAGMSTALVTTLVGGLLNIWLMANYQLLTTGTVRLINTIVELGEKPCRLLIRSMTILPPPSFATSSCLPCWGSSPW